LQSERHGRHGTILIDDGTTGVPSPFHDYDEQIECRMKICKCSWSSRGGATATARLKSDKQVVDRNRQLAFLMNSVLRRSLLRNSSVLHRQLWISNQILPSHICSRAGWRQYSTHNPDGFKDKSAVGVSHLHIILPPFAALFNALPECRYLPLKQRPFSLLLVPVSISTLDRKSNGCKNKSVSPCRLYSLVTFLNTWSREGVGVTLSWSCPRRWAIQNGDP
jgi:hypothetical protein